VTNPDSSAAGYSVTAIDLGTSAIRGPELFWMAEWDRWFPLQFMSILIEGPGVRALINTSPPEDLDALAAILPGVEWLDHKSRAHLKRTPDQMLQTALRRRGVEPEEITHVVLTPLELYATGTVDQFQQARIVMSRRGWEHFHVTHHHPHDRRWRSFLEPTLIALVTDDWDRVALLEDEDEVAPGIRTWWAGTHHRSSLVVEVDTPDGVVCVSDAFFYYENLESNRVIGLCENIYEAESSYARVRKAAQHIVPLHDPAVFARYPGGAITRPNAATGLRS
jgi:hypothetical protein